MKYVYRKLLLAGMCLSPFATFAANIVDLSHQQVFALNRFVAVQNSIKSNLPVINLVETSRAVDFNQTSHIRFKETYGGYPVLGGEGIIHIPQSNYAGKSLPEIIASAQQTKGWMNGKVYGDFQTDLRQTPAYIFNAVQAEKATREAIALYKQNNSLKADITNKENQLIVYIDNNNKAHWAFVIKFAVKQVHAKPAYIMDAFSFQVYRQWNDIKSFVNPERNKTSLPNYTPSSYSSANKKILANEALGGGYGGNPKMGRLIYDGAFGHMPALNIERDAETESCYFRNENLSVIQAKGSGQAIEFGCAGADSTHNNVYWSGELEKANEGFSPVNDAYYGGTITQNMYSQWVKSPIVTAPDGQPATFYLAVHSNAWDPYVGDIVQVSDGDNDLYPLVSVPTIAFTSSFLFTAHHSNLEWGFDQSAGVSLAYNCMASKAAEFFAYGKNDWEIGKEVTKRGGPIRYMDMPSKDCDGRQPGDNCSIDHMSQWKGNLLPHYTSGIFNRTFYLLATSPDWDVKKAFVIFAHANINYWTSNTNFSEAACGVIHAAKDYKYDVETVKQAFNTVGVNIKSCG